MCLLISIGLILGVVVLDSIKGVILTHILACALFRDISGLFYSQFVKFGRRCFPVMILCQIIPIFDVNDVLKVQWTLFVGKLIHRILLHHPLAFLSLTLWRYLAHIELFSCNTIARFSTFDWSLWSISATSLNLGLFTSSFGLGNPIIWIPRNRSSFVLDFWNFILRFGLFKTGWFVHGFSNSFERIIAHTVNAWSLVKSWCFRGGLYLTQLDRTLPAMILFQLQFIFWFGQKRSSRFFYLKYNLLLLFL